MSIAKKANEWTSRPISKNEHLRTSAMLRNIWNIRICMGKNLVSFPQLTKMKQFLLKNSLPYIKCVLRLSCVVHGPIYGPFMGCTVNGFLSL